MRQLIVRSGWFITLGAGLLLLLLGACVPTQARYPQVIEGSPTAQLTAQPVLVEPTASPTVQPTSVPSPTPTAIPTASPSASGDLSWLTPQPSAAIEWKTYQGKFEGKDFGFSYQLSYPADWIVYPHDFTVQIQTFADFETPDQAPPGLADGYMKIDVGFDTPCALAKDCQLTGTPVVVAGLPGAAAAYTGEVDPGLQIRTIAVQNGQAILRMTAYIYGKPDRVKAYEQIFGYMVSSLTFDP